MAERAEGAPRKRVYLYGYRGFESPLSAITFVIWYLQAADTYTESTGYTFLPPSKEQ